MARTGRPSEHRGYKEKKRRYTFEDGSAVRKLEELPEQRPSAKQRRKVRQTRKNRARAKAMGPGYVLFLTLVCVITLFLCVYYLQLRSTVTTQLENIAAQESKLSTLKTENDAYYNLALSSVTLDEVREAALNRLGMHYAGEDQIRYYSSEDSSYVRQYQDVTD